jgi:predicted ATPase/DNA-binding XRE family transcriptional regulator
MDETASFGAWLKQQRKAIDLTQRELAEYVGCSTVAIRKIEADEYRPSKQIAQRLAEYLEVPTTEHEAFVRFARGELRGLRSSEFLAPKKDEQEGVPRSHAPTNLPAQLTRLIGREESIGRILAFFERENVRLLTLIGPPGVGKTRLGIEVASRLLDRFEDGVFFVQLAPIDDPDLVIPAIARTLQVKEAGGRTISESLVANLRDRRMLLLLDNFEQVIAAAQQIKQLLAACARLCVLATSREVLHIHGEQQFSVPPLAYPDASRLPVIETLALNPAVELFVERARLVKPGFALREENAAAVAAICSQLDGLPLAIEIAAARVKILSTQAIRARLQAPEPAQEGRESRLSLLVTGPRDMHGSQERSASLRSAIAWSYNLLDPEEQTLFARLGVFTAGCTVAAAEAVCNAQGDLPLDVLSGLESLLDKSLLREEEMADGESRFVLLETIREYALEMLRPGQVGQVEEISRNHAEYYLALAEAAEPELRGSRQIVWLDRLEQEHGNLRTAIGWAQKHDVDMSLRLVVALWRFWWLRGYLSEGRERLRSTLSQPGVEDKRRRVWRAKALRGAGWLAYAQGDYAAARPLFEQGLALFEALGDSLGVANSLDNLGAIAFTSDEGERARSFYERSLAIRRESGAMHAVATSLNNLGLVSASQGDYSTARALLEESVAIYRELGDGYGIATSLNNLALVARGQGDYEATRPLLEESLSIRREMGDKYAIAYSLAGFAGLAAGREDSESFLKAARLLAATHALLDEIGARLEFAYRVEYERSLAAVRAYLDEETFAAAWQEGQAMGTTNLERAIAYALNPET